MDSALMNNINAIPDELSGWNTTSRVVLQGYHPRLTVAFKPNGNPAPCRIETHFVLFQLTNDAFLDRYELARMDFGPSVGVECFGDADLEAPAHSSAALQNSAVISVTHEACVAKSIDIPFHLRYQPSSTNNRYSNVTITHPTVFNANRVPISINALSQTIRVPVGNGNDYQWVSFVDQLAIFASILYILYSCWNK